MAQDPSVVAVRVQALETALQRLVEAQAQNHAAIHKAFFMTDAHLWVLKMICIDIVENKVVKTNEGGVDLPKYYAAFNEMNKAQASVQAPAPIEETEEEEDSHVEVFGGDAANVANP